MSSIIKILFTLFLFLFDQGKSAVDAAKQVGIKHFVYSGLENVQKILGIPCPHFDAKAAVEEYLQQSGLPFTSVRFSLYFDNFTTMLPPTKVGENSFALSKCLTK